MRGEPLAGGGVETAAGHQIIDMDVIAHVPRPGLQRPEQADRPAQPRWVARHGLQRVGGGPEEEIVDQRLMGAGRRIQAVGQGEGDQKIRDRPELPELRVAPTVGAVLAAFGTVAVAAGVIAVEKGLARVAIEHFAPSTSVRQAMMSCSALRWPRQHLLTILFQVGRAVFPDDVRKFQHERFLRTRPTSPV